MTTHAITIAAALAQAGNLKLGKQLGGVYLGDATDHFPVFRAPNRRVARALKAAGYRYFTWWVSSDKTVRGWH